PAKDHQPETWQYTIKNTSDAQRWIYLNWRLPWNYGQSVDDDWYWSGRGEPRNGTDILKNPAADARDSTTMLQAVYNNKSGVALALPPDQIVTQLKQSLISPLPASGIALQLQLQIALVLDAGQSDTFPIEIYHFEPRYGFLDAL